MDVVWLGQSGGIDKLEAGARNVEIGWVWRHSGVATRWCCRSREVSSGTGGVVVEFDEGRGGWGALGWSDVESQCCNVTHMPHRV